MKAKRFFYLMIFGFVLSITAAVGAIYYGDKLLSEKSSSLAKLKGERDAQQDVITKIRNVGGNARELEELKKLVNEVLPGEKRQSDLVADFLYTASSEAGIPTSKIQNISFTSGASPDALSGAVKSKDIPGLYEYPFTIQLKDIPYSTLIKFFGELELNKRIITIDNFDISPSIQDPNTLDTVSLSIKTYLKP